MSLKISFRDRNRRSSLKCNKGDKYSKCDGLHKDILMLIFPFDILKLFNDANMRIEEWLNGN